MNSNPAASPEDEKLSTDGDISSPIDRTHLARYTQGNADLEQEVLTLFADQSDVYMKRLHEAATGKAWHDAAHSLKGSATAIGAFGVAELAASAEALLGEGTQDERNRLLARLETRLVETKTYIRNLQSHG